MKLVSAFDVNQCRQAETVLGCRTVPQYSSFDAGWDEHMKCGDLMHNPPRYIEHALVSEPLVSYLDHFFKWVWCIRPVSGCPSPERVAKILTAVRGLATPKFELNQLPRLEPEVHLQDQEDAQPDLDFDYEALQIMTTSMLPRRIRSREIPSRVHSRAFVCEIEDEEDEIEFNFDALRIGNKQ